jgi:phosphonate transport system substrate-binding protein
MFAVGTGLALGACDPGETETVELTTLRVGILPDQSEEHLRRIYTPLFEHVARETSFAYEFVVPGSYGELETLFEAGEVDLAYFGGLTFLRTHQATNASPLVMRDVDAKFTTYLLVRANESAGTVEEFEGRRFSFGSELSTSGHLMPRYFLAELDIVPESFFEAVTYSGAHDRTAYDIRDSRADIGAVNAQVIDAMYADGRLNPDEVRVLWETLPYPDYVWALRKDVDPVQRQAIMDAFLSLSPAEKTHQEVLEALGAGAFLPASLHDFGRLTVIAREHGLLPEEG